MRILLPACLLTIFFLFLVVRQAPKQQRIEELVGHWHLVGEEQQSFYTTPMFEIGVDSNIVTLSQNDSVGIGRISEDLDTVFPMFYHGMMSIVLGEQNGDKIKARLLSDTTQNYYLQRYQADSAHLRLDFFDDEKITIHLPTHTDEKISPFPVQYALSHTVYLGVFAHAVEDIDSTPALKLGDKIVDVLDPSALALGLEQHRVKLPENKRDRIRPVFYADQATPGVLLDDLQQFYAARGYDTTYQAYEVPAGPTNFEVSYRTLVAEPLPDSITLFVDPAQLLCLGTAEGNQFSSGVGQPEPALRELPDSLGYGFYNLIFHDEDLIGLQVAYHGSPDHWRATDHGQYLVSAQFTSPRHRLWNGLQVGQPLARYAHLGFRLESEAYLREESRYSYAVSVDEGGLITSVNVYVNYFWKDKGEPNSSSPWLPRIGHRTDCRLRIL